MMYKSLTMGNVVPTRRAVISQVFESLFRYHTPDFRWRKMDRETGCVDVIGDEILAGSLLFITSDLIKEPFIIRVAQHRQDYAPGFQVRYGRGRLAWDVDDEPCYEVRKLI